MTIECGSTGSFDQWWAAREAGVLLRWVMYTSTGQRYDSRELAADDMPDDDFQCAVFYHWKGKAVYRELMSGRDEYWLPGASRPKRGRMMDDADYARLSDRVMRGD